MIPTIIPIHEDETFQSWLNRLAEENGFDIGSFSTMLFGYRQVGKISEIINLDRICQRENGSALFPDVETIIRVHTPAFVDQIYYSYAWQAKALVHMIRSREASALCGVDRLPRGRAGITKVCPLCMKEDLEEYDRVIIHTPHQARGVEACWKHGVLLRMEGTEDMEVSEASTAQKETAVFSHEIYGSNLFTDYSAVCRCIGLAGGRYTDLIEDAIRTGYISDAVDAENLKTTLMSGDYKKSPKGLVGYLTYLFKNFNSFRSMISVDDSDLPEWVFMRAINGRYRLEGRFGMVVRLTCLRCGNSFHTHPEAVLRGVGCPVCDLDTDRKVLVNRYAERLSKDWGVTMDETDPLSGIQVIHKPCGHATGIDLRRLIWDKPVKCRFCSPHVGEETTAENGMRITVIAYRAHDDIDVEFEDGTDVRKKRYSDFRKGHISYPHMDARTERHKRERVGEKSRATNGMMMTIAVYRRSDDIDVLFEDDMIVTGVSYDSFKRGNVQHPTKSINATLRNNRIGETSMTKAGRLMTLIAYRSAASVDVQFEDGKIKTTSYLRFKNGQVQHPDDKVQTNRVGEEHPANNGMMMTIIKYVSSSNVTIQFSDGAIREGVSYRDIRKGAVSHPNNMRKRSVHVDRIGETGTATCGMRMTIIAYRTCNDIDVQFEDGEVAKGKTYQNFKSGEIAHP